MFGVFETTVRITFTKPMKLSSWLHPWIMTHFGFIPGSERAFFPISHEAMISDKVDGFYANTILTNEGFAEAWEQYNRHYPNEVSTFRFCYRLQSEDAPKSPSPEQPPQSPSDDTI